MRKRIYLFLIFVILLNASVYSDDSPSGLFTNLVQKENSNFFWEFEIKTFFYNNKNENFFLGGVSSALSYEGDNISFQFEGIYKEKKIKSCNNSPQIYLFQIRRLNIEKHFSDSFSLTFGRQEITVATGLLLDDFFDGITFKIGEKNYLSGGTGIYTIYTPREATGCQKCFSHNYRPWWKNLSHTQRDDIKMAFLNYTFRIKRNEFGLFYLRTQTDNSDMRTNNVSLYSKIRVTEALQIFSEFIIQHFDKANEIAIGFYGNLQKMMTLDKIGNFLVRLRYLYGSTEKDVVFTPIFGAIHISERQDFTVRQGNIYGWEISFCPSFFKRFSIRFGYYLNSEDSYFNFVSDEFDTTIELSLNKRERFKIFTTELNLDRIGKFKIITTYAVWSGVYTGSQISLNLRLVI